MVRYKSDHAHVMLSCQQVESSLGELQEYELVQTRAMPLSKFLPVIVGIDHLLLTVQNGVGISLQLSAYGSSSPPLKSLLGLMRPTRRGFHHSNASFDLHSFAASIIPTVPVLTRILPVRERDPHIAVVDHATSTF